MTRLQLVRRAIALTLLVAGGALMLLSPSVEVGLISFGLGVVLELVGVVVERRSKP